MLRLALLTLLVAVVPAQESKRFEVLVLGTLHAPWQFRTAGFTPAHVRATLEAAAPHVLGVESNPAWFTQGRFHDVTWEAQGVAIPWARERELPVCGVDWMDVERYDRDHRRRCASRYEQLTAVRPSDRPLPLGMFGRVHRGSLARLLEWWNDPTRTFTHMNGIDGDAFAKRWLKGSDPTSPDFGGRRNQEIAKRCAAVMKRHPGRRLVVVIGAGHKAVLDALFSRMDGVRVLELGADVPVPDGDAVAAAWTAQDLICAVGHNLDGERSYFSNELVDLDRVTQLVERLAGLGGEADVVDYFRARIAQRRGRAGAALEIYDRLADVDQGPELYPYRLGHWRMYYAFKEAVDLERARCLQELGRHAQAAALLDGFEERLAEVPAVTTSSGGLTPLVDAPDVHLEAELARWRSTAPAFVEAGSNPHGPLHGSASLHVRVKKRRTNGLAGVARAVTFEQPHKESRTLTWRVALRGTKVMRVVLEAYIPRDNGTLMVPIGTERIRRVGAWRHEHLTFELPADTPQIRLFAYVDGMPGARLWLDDGRLHVGTPPVPDVPDDWEPRWLARQYVRTLRGH